MKKMLFSFLFLTQVFAGDVYDDLIQKIEGRFFDTQSDALLIMQDGKELLKLGNTERPFESMSITKSMINLAIGTLIDSGKLETINTPIYHYYPEWDIPKKREITIRHLMNHTSGLDLFQSVEQAYLVPDFIECALEAKVIHELDEHFAYNNRAVNLLSGVVEKITHMRLDEYVQEVLFDPMDIHDTYWNLDFAGHSMGMCGLEISAKSLTKIGQLILNRGRWDGKQLLSDSWIERSFQPSQSHNKACGLLWWLDRSKKVSWTPNLIHTYENLGLNVDCLKKLEGKPIELHDHNLYHLFGSEDKWNAFHDAVEEAELRFFNLHIGEVRGYRADGYLGQYLLILPEHNLTAVRMIEYGKLPDDQVDPYRDFISLVHELVECD